MKYSDHSSSDLSNKRETETDRDVIATKNDLVSLVEAALKRAGDIWDKGNKKMTERIQSVSDLAARR